MSAWAEYKAGMITEAEYAYICRAEADETEPEPEEENEEDFFEDDEIDEF